ncbi:hypothetical protein [Streptomyces tendae]|uniref:hypothetical protein n=1 Tax=Streptomyces tendae TaxID=1932 RepID=UPI0036B18557
MVRSEDDDQVRIESLDELLGVAERFVDPLGDRRARVGYPQQRGVRHAAQS